MGEQSWGYTILGVFLSITATLCSSVANIYIKITAEKERLAKKKTAPCCQIGWYIVVLLYIGNGLLDFSAFAFAAMSVLAPVSAVTIAINAVLAHVWLKEVLSRRDMIGTAFLFLGAALAVFAVPRESDDAVTMQDIEEKFQRPLFGYFTLVKVVIMLLCCYVIHRTNWLHPKRAGAEATKNKRPSINCIEDQVPVQTSEQQPQQPLSQSESIPAPEAVGKEGVDTKFQRPSDVNTATTNSSSITDPVSPTSADSNSSDITRPLREENPSGDMGDPLLLSESSHQQYPALSTDTQGQTTVTPKIESNDLPEVEASGPKQNNSSLGADPDAFWLRIRAVCYSMITAGVGAWTNQLAKAGVQLIDTTVHSDNQLFYWQAWAIILSVVPCAGLQLKAMSAMMDAFEAVLIIPIYQCIFIFNLILQGAFYFEELDGLDEENLGWFVASLIFILVGIFYLSRTKAPR